MVSSTSPFINISRLLNRLLQSIYDQIASSTSSFKGADMIQSLEEYKKKGYLRSTTLFTTLHVHHILTIFIHEQAIQTLERFLYDHLPSSKQIQGLSISTILQLVQLLFDNQWFIYNDKVYRQIRGSDGCGSPLMLLLVNIILFDWQKEFVSFLKQKNEIFCR
jgi:hypothetical protein